MTSSKRFHEARRIGVQYRYHQIVMVLGSRLDWSSIRQRCRETASDYRKDRLANSYRLPYEVVWCAAIPKSGSTRIKQILELLPFVDASTSLLRRSRLKTLDHEHGISHELMSSFPHGKYTFIKTHSHYSPDYLLAAVERGARIVVSMRDLRDMMISRYYHVCSEPSHWQHEYLKGLGVKEGFLASLIDPTGVQEDPISYYANWLDGWNLCVQDHPEILAIWYEDFQSNQIENIDLLLTHIGARSILTATEVQNHLDELRAGASRKGLEAGLAATSRDRLTFRKGTIGGFRDFMDGDLEREFWALVPSHAAAAATWSGFEHRGPDH